MNPMPRPVAVFYHPDCLLHDTGPQHPERAERLMVAKAALEEASYAEFLQWHQPGPAPAIWIEGIHSSEYRQFIEESCLRGTHFVDMGDTVICEDSYRAALLSAGAAIEAVDSVLSDKCEAAFSLTRPPGHHASTEKPMGFCLFNNVAIAANYALKSYGLEKVCILDFDVHHGNGTQDVFYGSPSVLFCSLHQLPLWPHTGESEETGMGGGHGSTLNCPVPGGAGIDLYMNILEKKVGPALETFKPELILISAGFDAHRLDPLAGVHLDTEDFYGMTKWILQQAGMHSDGRVVSFLEGGYNLEVLAASITAHVQALVEGPS
jgi:acetoin utilization deacetylase AcuC-like enzyme